MRDFISTSSHVMKSSQVNNGHTLTMKTEALKSNSLPKSFFSSHYCARRINTFKNSVNKHIQGSIRRWDSRSLSARVFFFDRFPTVLKSRKLGIID
ncbi:unnamed protein product [Angiostrongylus costaricensis]|uniref:Ovule protein n=1 Tax=Angiostrongylus costaricensis TaxID=334426 RepID=A0A0R3PVN3_ANGCS|nr:unnamed protein product [Angiostrongylus costaricensis]